MRNVFRAPLSTAIALAVGLVILVGYFIQIEPLRSLRSLLLQWALALAAIALLVGVINLLLVHGRKIATGKKGAAYSYVLILSLIGTLAVAGYFGVTGYWSLWLFKYIQVPIETSLIAILLVVLVYAGARILHKEITLFKFVFIGTSMIVLLGSNPWLGACGIPGLYGLDGLKELIVRLLAVAGARGLLIGVALGILATGLRIIIGADRPYGG